MFRYVTIDNTSPLFYSLLGPFLSRREIVRELGATVWDEDGKQWVVAMEGSNVAGFAGLKGNLCCSDYVLPEYRQNGLYGELMRRRLQLSVEPKRAVATDASLPAFIKAGFKATGARGRYTLVSQ